MISRRNVFLVICLLGLSAGCSRPVPPAPRAIWLEPETDPVHVLVARDDYNGAGLNIAGVSLAGHKDVYWDVVNPANGIYDWDGTAGAIDGIDDYLAAVADQTVTLRAGEVISRPVWFTIPVFWTQHPSSPADCANNVPGWLKLAAPDHVIGAWTPTPAPFGTPVATPNPQAVPGMDYAAFRTAYGGLLQALAQHLQVLTEAQRGQIAGFFIPGGYNNENQIEAAYCNLYLWNSDLGTTITKSEYWAFISEAVTAFHEALPDYPIFTLAAAQTWPDQRCLIELQLLTYTSRHLGLGFNGMQPDVPGWITRPASQVGCGAVETMVRNADALPGKAEPALVYQEDYQRMYWAWLFAVGGLRVDMVDAQSEWFEDGLGNSQFGHFVADYDFPVSFYDFVVRSLGNTAETAPDLWTVFHTTEYPRTQPGYNDYRCYDGAGNVYCHGWEGNFNHFMGVAAGSVTVRCSVYGMPGCQDAGLPTHSGASPWGSSTSPYSRHAGQLSGTTTLAISSTVGLYGTIVDDAVLRVAWLGNSVDKFYVEYPFDGEGWSDVVDIERVNDGEWHWSSIALPVLYVGNGVAGDTGLLRITYDGTAPTLHMVWVDLSEETAAAGSTPTATPTPGPSPTPTRTPTPAPPAIHFTEYSPRGGLGSMNYDWFPDGALNDGDGFVEIYSATGLADAGYELEVSSGAVTLTHAFTDTLFSGAYVVWNHEMGLTLPSGAVTLTLAGFEGQVIATAVVAGTPAAQKSLQLCAGGWAADLPSPGRDCGVWTVVPTPTGWPTGTATPTWTPGGATATWTPAPTGTPTPTATWTPAPTNTPTNTPTATPINTPTPTRTATPTSTPTATPTSAATFLNLQVNANTDDADQQEFGTMYRAGCTSDSSAGNACVKTSDAGTTSRYWGGLRFNAVTIPQGTTILTATLEFYVTSSTYDDPKFDIYGQAADNPGTFQATAHDIDGRSRTTAYTTWSADGIGTGWITGPDIAAVVQEIVNRGGWASGNSLVLILKPYDAATEEFRWRSYDSGDGAAVKLHVKY